MKLYNSHTLRQIEANHAHCNPSLMARAGAAVADQVRELLLSLPAASSVLLVCGPGNNGGDALVAARHLRQTGVALQVCLAASADSLPPDAQAAHQAWLASGGTCASSLPADLNSFGLIVDALFGIGLQRPITGLYAEWVAAINASGAQVLALDVPSGLQADSGCALGAVVRAQHTLTFIGRKPGLYTADGPDYCGRIALADLGLDLSGYPSAGALLQVADFAAQLQARAHNTHKGSFGNARVLGGDAGMVGAALLAGRAALHLGAGRVFVGLLDAAAPRVDSAQVELMLRSADEMMAMDGALCLGTGMGQGADALRLLTTALAGSGPVLLDADALNLLASNPELHSLRMQRGAALDLIITPHPTEAARLLGCSTAQVQSDRIGAAQQLAQQWQAVVVLKGCGSIIATPAGDYFINTSGNAGLATAGTGDVLSGFITALLAQGWPALAAAQAGVHVHGCAGDALSQTLQGCIVFTAGELIPYGRQLLNQWVAEQLPKHY